MRPIFIIIVSLICLKSYAQDAQNLLSAGQADLSPHFYEENGKMGLKKNSRKHLTPAVYDTLIRLNDDSYVGKRYSVNKQQALWGLLSNSGTVILPFRYFTCEVTQEHLVLGAADNNRIRKGVYDFNGTNIISDRYEDINISERYIIARSGTDNNIFTIDGIKQAEYRADSVDILSDNYITVYHDGKAGLESIDQSVSVEAKYKAIRITNQTIEGQSFPEWQLINGYDTVVFHRQDIDAWGNNIIASTGNCFGINQFTYSIQQDVLLFQIWR